MRSGKRLRNLTGSTSVIFGNLKFKRLPVHVNVTEETMEMENRHVNAVIPEDQRTP